MLTSLSEYLDLCVARREASDDDLWYRGIVDSTLKVSPGLHWNGLEREWDLASKFLTRAPQLLSEKQTAHHHSGQLDQGWEWYFLMQHYGMPTRLVDWTESPLVALYFALASFTARDAPSSVPCVWLLNPAALNGVSIDFEGLVVPGGSFSKHWLFATDPDETERCMPGKPATFEHNGKQYSNDAPIAILPVRSNPRILAQQGVFTVHGASQDSLDDYLAEVVSKRSGTPALEKIEIDPSAAVQMRERLEMLQIHELALFPELPVLGKRLRERALEALSKSQAGVR